MIHELNTAIITYQANWQAFVNSRKDKAFFGGLRPMAVTWKIATIADFDACFMSLRDECDQVHFGWFDERWIGVLHLKDKELPWDLSIVKIYQRRPGSSDTVGLDHIDFFVPDGNDMKAVLQAETDLRWTEEKTDYCDWVSLWFDGGPEAKLRTRGKSTVDAVIAELTELRDKVVPQSYIKV